MSDAPIPGRADRIQAEFPPGVVMPAALRALCDYLDGTGYPISGGMKIRPEGEGLKHWFGPGSTAWQQLAGFGAGPDGSTLAFWLHAGNDAATAPVVHLGSEGDRLMVLANDFQDFMRLLAIGYSELGFDDLDAPPEDPGSAEGLRRWLRSRYDLVPPAVGEGIVARAQARHPDFEAWVIAAQALRDQA